MAHYWGRRTRQFKLCIYLFITVESPSVARMWQRKASNKVESGAVTSSSHTPPNHVAGARHNRQEGACSPDMLMVCGEFAALNTARRLRYLNFPPGRSPVLPPRSPWDIEHCTDALHIRTFEEATDMSQRTITTTTLIMRSSSLRL